MQLSRYTDYALRILIYLSIHHDRLSSITEIATCYEISQNHLMKIVHQLGKAGFIKTVRGRRGGLQLINSPKDITIGSIILHTEGDNDPIQCKNCLIINRCIVKNILTEALQAFYTVLNKYTLDDIITNKIEVRQLLQLKMPDICHTTL